MNKYIFILGMTAMALFAACSTDEGLDAEEMARLEKEREAAILAEAISDSEIPITIGTGTHSNYNVTRAPLESDANGLFATETGKYLGVFCLAVGKQTGAPDISALRSINWTVTGEYRDLILKMSNVPAKVTNDGVLCNVQFLDSIALKGKSESSRTWFYPMNDWIQYNFYAYYPRQDSIIHDPVKNKDYRNLQISDSEVLEKYYLIDGSQDIIWAASISNDNSFTDAKPYCAKYFRKKKAQIEEANDPTDNIANYYPQFNFEHKLSQFVFNVKAASTDDAAVLSDKHLKITNVWINNVYTQLSLIVASKTDASTNGTLAVFGTPAVARKALNIKKIGADVDRFDQDKNKTLDHALPISDNATDVGLKTMGYLMVPPTDVVAAVPQATYADYKLMVEVEYDKDDGTTTEQLQYILEPPTGGFIAGHKYNVQLVFYAPSEVQAYATLAGWENGEDIVLE